MWWDRLFSHPLKNDGEVRVVLNQEEKRQASKLSKLTGRTRDQVLREAYRKSDAIMEKSGDGS